MEEMERGEISQNHGRIPAFPKAVRRWSHWAAEADFRQVEYIAQVVFNRSVLKPRDAFEEAIHWSIHRQAWERHTCIRTYNIS